MTMVAVKLTMTRIKKILWDEKQKLAPTLFAYRGSNLVFKIQSRRNLFYGSEFVSILRIACSSRHIDSICLAIPTGKESATEGYDFAIICKSVDFAKACFYQFCLSQVSPVWISMRILVNGEEIDSWPLEGVLASTRCSPVEAAKAKCALMEFKKYDDEYAIHDFDEHEQETMFVTH